MISAKYQPRYSLITRSLHPSLKMSKPKQLTVYANQILITDYSNSNHQYERKKKRCPLFLMNKSQKKKNTQFATIFTNQGILVQRPYSPHKTPALDNKGSALSSRPKCLSSKRQTITSAYNFTKTITPKKVDSTEDLAEFPLFYFYPKERCLQSVQTDRQTTKIMQSRSSRSNHAKQKLKSEGNQLQSKQLGAWRTKDVEFQQIL